MASPFREAKRLLALVLILLAGANVSCAPDEPKSNATVGSQTNLAATTTNSSNIQVSDAQTISTNSSQSLDQDHPARPSGLQAEESRQVDTISVLAPPPTNPGESGVSAPVSFTGGSGNSYMSITRDGSNRYQFGFDTGPTPVPGPPTDQGSLAAVGPGPVRPAGKRASPRLMREESRLEDGTVVGRYGYTDPFNVFRIVQYVAGPDGYFATEDVGAVNSESRRGELQLNKQLHKALEEARARRQKSTAAGPRGARARAQGATSSLAEPESTWLEDTLAGSGSHHHSVRFATRINHVVGSNGVTYATAFRPLLAGSPASGRHPSDRPVGGELVEPAARPFYASTRLADRRRPPDSAPDATIDDIVDTIEQRQRAQQQLEHEQLRSRLPAPIYSPTHYSAEGAGFEPAAPVGGGAHSSPPSPASVLQSSPVWSVLSNNYNGNYQSSVIIDHTDGLAAGAHQAAASLGALNQQMSASFQREAALLKSVRQRQQANSNKLAGQHQANYDKPVSNQTPTLSGQLDLSQFGARTGNWPASWTQVAPATSSTADHHQQQNFNYEFALKHFDPPLYHPEVHETRPDENAFASGQAPLDHTGPMVSYSSTVIYPAAPAEQNYELERVRVHQGAVGLGGDVMQNSASEASRIASNHLSTTAPASNSTLLAPSQSPAAGLTEGSRAITTTSSQSLGGRISTPPSDQAQGPKSLAYATRLWAPESAFGKAGHLRVPDQYEDMHMEDSEQVAYLSTAATNGTSRARLPDRSKKLSSIFKARTASLQVTDSGADGAPQAKIRRPVPVNVKKQRQPSAAIRLEPTTTKSPPVESSPAPTAPLVPTSTEPPSVAPILQTGAEGHSSGADLPKGMIIGATSGGPESTLNKDLLEKIMRIQQEIAAKAAAGISTLPPPTSSPRVEATSSAASPTTASTTSTTTSTTSTTTTTTTELPPTSTTTTTTSTTTTSRPTTTTTTGPPPSSTTTAHSASSEPVQSVTSLVVQKNFLTGPLVKVDTSTEQDDFMSRLVQDMDAFDSARASVMMDTSVRSVQPVSSAAESAGPLPAVGTNLSENATSTPRPIQLVVQPASSPRPVGLELSPNSGETGPGDVPTVAATAATTTESATTGSTSAPPAASLTSTSTLATSTTTTAASATLAPATTTTIAAPITTTTTTRAPRTRPANSTSRRASSNPLQHRFGRLVIKRGDKVVARFNASEPIPDSMIPIGGNSSEIIMPDMPRLGMRRSVKRFVQPRLSPTTPGPEPTSANSTAATGGHSENQTQAQNQTATGQPPGKRSLSRQGRSYAAGVAQEHDDLATAETISGLGDDAQLSGLGNALTVTSSALAAPADAQTSMDTRPMASLAGSQRRNWSSRLRDTIRNQLQPTIGKKYDPKEDLKKLVEKITHIESVGMTPAATRKPQVARSARLVVPKKARLTRPADELDDDVARRVPTARQQLREMPKQNPVIQTTTTTTQAPKEQAGNLTDPFGNQSETGALVSSASFNISHTGQRVSGSHAGPSQGAPLSADSHPTTVMSSNQTHRESVAAHSGELVGATNGTTTVMATGGELSGAQGLNLSQPGEPVRANSSATVSKISQSRSASFTMTLSPVELDKHWHRLRPVNLSSEAGTQMQLAPDASEVRIDSRGHIHIRNNQSLTVHVDIEPPKRLASVARALDPAAGIASNKLQRRITSRDTSGSVNEPKFGSDDLQRLSALAPASHRPGQPAGQERAATLGAHLSANESDLLKRKPRMLCIEVESGSALGGPARAHDPPIGAH